MPAFAMSLRSAGIPQSTKPFVRSKTGGRPCSERKHVPVLALKNRDPLSSDDSNLAGQAVSNNQPEASRRQALQALLAGLAAASARPAFAGAEDNARQGEISHTDAEWRELLSQNQYAVLRTAATEPRNSSPLATVSACLVF